jgi:hypothetical protein
MLCGSCISTPVLSALHLACGALHCPLFPLFFECSSFFSFSPLPARHVHVLNTLILCYLLLVGIPPAFVIFSLYFACVFSTLHFWLLFYGYGGQGHKFGLFYGISRL